ncbi:MAG TPA: AI-2E family transporter [Ktedonobacterales bacterium]|nr:AI-2E family transporter [Ktedonobacterales bacterium]
MPGTEPQQQPQPEQPETTGQSLPTHIKISIAPQTIWLAIGATVGTILVLLFLNSIIPVLLVLFAAITIAEAMRPAVRVMNRYRIPRWLGVLIIYLLGLGTLVGLGYLISQPLVEQITQFLNNLPQYTTDLENFTTQAQGALNNLPGGSTIPDQIANLVGNIASIIVSIPATIISIVSDIVITLFMALFWTAYSDGLREFFLSFFPPHLRRKGADVLDEMSVRLGGYVRGVVINMFVIGILAGVADWLLGLKFPLLLGVFAGLTEFIPLVGPYIGAAPAVLLGLIISPTRAVIVAVVYLLVQQFEGQTLVPLVMNRVVRLRPLTVIVALAVGTLLFGLEGALLAVPFAAVTQVFIVRVLAPWIRSATGGDHHNTTPEEARPRPTKALEAEPSEPEEQLAVATPDDAEVGTPR